MFLLPIMPSRTEDYEVLSTIGSGSYGKCQKIRRKSDGKVTRVDLMTPLHSVGLRLYPLTCRVAGLS